MKHITIIGVAGQLGTELVEILSPRYTVRGLNRDDVDITQPDQLRSELESASCDVVINCAAYTRVDDAETHRREAFAVNTTGARYVAEACAVRGALCVYISTDYVFDGLKPTPYSETDAPAPLNVYGRSKLEGEQLVAMSATRWLVIRSASLYGKVGSRGKGGNFVNSILQKARAGERLRVVDDIRMSPTSARDAAGGIAELIEANATGIVHLTNAGSCSWHEFATTILELADLRTPIEPVSAADYPAAARRPSQSALATDHFKKIVGHHPRPWRDALADYLLEGERPREP